MERVSLLRRPLHPTPLLAAWVLFVPLGAEVWGLGQQDEPQGIPEHALRHIEGLRAPGALTFAPDGSLLVCETAADRVVRLDPQGRRLGVLGGPGLLRLPAGIAAHPDGRVFVADSGAHRLVVLGADGAPAAILGGPGAGPGRFHEPLGLALDPDRERLAVCDRGNRRVQVLDLLGEPLHVIGGEGAPVELVGPVAAAFAAEGSLLVADRDAHRVWVFGADGAPLRHFGDWGAHPGLMAAPSGIAVAGERVFVGERENHRVQVFDLAGQRVGGFGEHALRPGEGLGKLHYPTGLALDPGGVLLALAEPMDERVQLFSVQRSLPPSDLPPMPGVPQPPAHYGPEPAAAGSLLAIAEPETRSVQVFDDTEQAPRLIARVGRSGQAPGQFLAPLGLALDLERARLAVSDPVLRRISIFHLRGHPQQEVRYDPLFWAFVKSLDLARWFELEGRGLGLAGAPEPGALCSAASGELFVADRRNDRVLVFSPRLEFLRLLGAPGREPGHLGGPSGLALAPDGGRLYVVESTHARVQILDPSGRHLGFLAGAEGAPRLSLPHGVAVDPEGRVFVTDAGEDRLLAFSAEGEFLGAIGARGLGRGELAQPRGLALDGEGRLVVLDHANHRGQRFDAQLGFAGAFGSRLYVRPALRPGRKEGEGR